MQNRICGKAMSALEEVFDAKVSCGRISFKPFNALVIDNLLILDEKYSPADTFARVGHLSATISVRGLVYGDGIHLGRLKMKDVDFHLITEAPKSSSYTSNLQRIFRIKEKKERKDQKVGPNLFDIRRARAEGLRFRLTSLIADSSRYKGRGMNYSDLDARASFKAHKISFGGSLFKAAVDELKLSEKCGYDNAVLRGRLRVGLGKTLIENFRIKDEMSDVNMPHFAMIYSNAGAFANFVNEVSFDAVMENSILDYATVQAFSYNLPNCRLKAKIEKCTVTGPVNDLNVENLAFTDLRSGVKGKVSCHLIGVAPKREDRSASAPNFSIDASVGSLQFTGQSITAFLGHFAPKVNLTAIVPGHNYTFNGKCTGYLQKMDILGSITSPGIGGMGTRLLVRNASDKSRPIELTGSIYSDRLNLGEVLGKKALGECSMHSAIRASLTKGNPSVIIDSLSVTKFGFLEYDYSGIGISGKFDDNAFDGRITINDPNLKFTYEGKASVPKQGNKLTYIFDAVLDFANLSAINIDRRDESSFASMKLSSVFRYYSSEESGGKIKVTGIKLGTESGIKEIGDIVCDVNAWDDIHHLTIKSDFADAFLSGEKGIPDFISDLRAVSIDRHLPSMRPGKAPRQKFSGSSYKAGVQFHDSRNLLSFAAPGKFVSDSSGLTLNLDNTGILEAHLTTPGIAFGNNYIKKADIGIDNIGGGLRMTFENEELKLGEFIFKDCFIDSYAHNDSLSTSLKYDSTLGENNFGELYVNTYFSRNASDSLLTVIHALPSTIHTIGSIVELHESKINIGGGQVHIDSLDALMDGRKVALSGGISRHSKDSLSLEIDSLDLSILSRAKISLNRIGGFLSGNAYINSPLSSSYTSNVDLRIDSLSTGGQKYRSIQIKGGWNKDENAMKLTLDGADEDSTAHDLTARWIPGSDMEVNADLKRMNIAMVQPFIKSGISEMTGCLNGKISATIGKDGLKVSSEGTSAENLEATVSSTGVHYRINGPFSIKDKTLSLDRMKVEDKNSGIGEVSGALSFDKERNIILDATVKTPGIDVLDIEQAFDRNLSGHLRARADVKVCGPLYELSIEGEVGTSGNGNIFIATGRANATKASDLLSFKKKEDNADLMSMIRAASKEKKRKSGINLKLQASINPGTETTIELDKNSGNGIIANGKGNFGIELQSRTGKTNLTGDYVMDRGKFHFEIPGIVNKDFSISSGSRVKLNGNLPNSELDIHGVYNMKTSLSTLIADSTASGRRAVQCLIGISGKLSNPKIDFDVNVPDLDPTTRTQVEAALNTDDKKQKQFIALLVMGSFLPNEQSGVVNSSNILYSNVSEIMSGQLNGILQKLDIPIDLGVGYQQSSAGKDMFDVAVSTQLFNNRVIVDGTVANRQYKTTGNTASVVGDVNVEVKLDRPGNFRLKLFSHSADEHTSFLDYSQRNGVGVSLQKEFDNIKDLVVNFFTTSKKRESNRAEEQERKKNKIKMTINE